MLSLDYTAADAGAEAALAAAGPPRAILLGVEVEPSNAPASLVILHQGEPLPQKPLVSRTCMLPQLCQARVPGADMECMVPHVPFPLHAWRCAR